MKRTCRFYTAIKMMVVNIRGMLTNTEENDSIKDEVINELNNVYEFYPVITANNNTVWCLCFNNEQNLSKCINVYKSIICDGEW